MPTCSGLLADLDGVRARGYAVDDEENEAGVRCVGAAVYSASGSVLGGISVSGLTFTLTIDELHGIGPAVVTAAQRLSGALGYHPAARR
ncbi:MAG TPA: IclR family transcriptional regulator C-terminal domain-containing protein [Trebonia sp.]